MLEILNMHCHETEPTCYGVIKTSKYGVRLQKLKKLTQVLNRKVTLLVLPFKNHLSAEQKMDHRITRGKEERIIRTHFRSLGEVMTAVVAEIITAAG